MGRSICLLAHVWAGMACLLSCAQAPPRPAPHRPRPTHPTDPCLQIIAKVQSQGSAGLHIPLAQELAAGPFSCYPQYVALMKACWAIETSQRPNFNTIVQQLGCVCQPGRR